MGGFIVPLDAYRFQILVGFHDVGSGHFSDRILYEAAPSSATVAWHVVRIQRQVMAGLRSGSPERSRYMGRVGKVLIGLTAELGTRILTCKASHEDSIMLIEQLNWGWKELVKPPSLLPAPYLAQHLRSRLHDVLLRIDCQPAPPKPPVELVRFRFGMSANG
jgi:hypothetical protein